MKISYVDSIFDDSIVYIGDESYRRDLPAGSAKWMESDDKPAYLIFVCPCGCGALGAVTIKPFAPDGWTWNGNLNRPSLTPSIQRTTGCRWHGYLTDGEWRTC